MKLDRNINPDGAGKYALIKMRQKDAPILAGVTCDVEGGLGANYRLVLNEAIDFGGTPDTDFFVIRLKDKYAAPALEAYAQEAEHDDPEYAKEIYALAAIARHHPNRRMPD